MRSESVYPGRRKSGISRFNSKFLILPIVTLILVSIIFSSGFCEGQSVFDGNLQKARFPPLNITDKTNSGKIHQEFATIINESVLYSDFLPPKSSKIYKVMVHEKSILILFASTYLNKTGLRVKVEGPVDNMFIQTFYPNHYIYFIREAGDLIVEFSNLNGESIRFNFFVDLSESLITSHSKFIPVENSLVSFHVDLKKGDEVWLNVESSSDFQLEMKAYALYYEVPPGRHQIYAYAESFNKNLNFTANLEGRYYILMKAIRGFGEFMVATTIKPSLFSQEWFWPSIGTSIVLATSSVFIIKIGKIRNLNKTEQYTVIGGYLSFVTMALLSSFFGAFIYQTIIWKPLFYFSIIFYGLSSATKLYVAYLDRKERYTFCPYCGRKIDFYTQTRCCGKRVKNVSFFWYLTPLSFIFLSSCISYLIFGLKFPEFYLGLMLGSFFGGILAWLINRKVYRNKARAFFMTGVIFSFLSPIIITNFIDLIFIQNVVLNIPGFVRVRLAPPGTSPKGSVLIYILIVILISYLNLNEIVKLLRRKRPSFRNLHLI